MYHTNAKMDSVFPNGLGHGNSQLSCEDATAFDLEKVSCLHGLVFLNGIGGFFLQAKHH